MMEKQLRKDNVLNTQPNKIRLSAPLQLDSIVDGVGFRCVLWTQGCTHHCVGCHNPQTHDLHAGYEECVENIITQIQGTNIQTGLTLSGGEPFLQAKALVSIVLAAKAKGMNIWAFTGFTYESLFAKEETRQLLQLIDVLVDGKYEEDKKHITLKFKGSANQRLIDVQESLKQEHVVLHRLDVQIA